MTQHWADSYRPDNVDDMALAPELRAQFKRYLSDGLPQSLILHGPPGVGKTTIATIIADQLYPGQLRVMRVKSAETGNVDYIRERVIGFMQRAGGSKLVIFEEATGLSPQAQEALRIPMEQLAEDCRVIFITNDQLTDAAVRDRCAEIPMEVPQPDECASVLERILAREGHTVAADAVRAFTRWYFTAGGRRSMRGFLSAAQDAIETRGSLTWKESAGMNMPDIVVAMALKHEPVMAQLGGALTHTLVTPGLYVHRIVEFAREFLTTRRKLPGSGDWTVWLGGLTEGATRDGTREALGRIFAVDITGYDPAFFAETMLQAVKQGAENVARARLNEAAAQGSLAPGTIEALAEQLKTIGMSAVPKSFWPTTLSELRAGGGLAATEEAPPEELITGLAWRGRLTLFAGREKLGKSTYVAAGVVAFTRGLAFLGYEQDGKPIPRAYDPEQGPGRVLWLAMDEALSEATGRLRAGGVNSMNIRVQNSETPAQFLATILRDDAQRPDLVVVDSLIAYAARASKEIPESGSAAAWSPIMRGLADLAHDCNVAIVLIAHARKSDNEYRDSSEIGAAVDAIITMKPHGERQDEVVRNIDIQGRRSITSRTTHYAVRLTGRQVDGVTRDEYVRELPPETLQDAAVAAKPVTLRQQILDALPPAGATGPAWFAAMNPEACSNSTFHRHRNQLIADGLVVQDGESYRRADVEKQ